MEINLSQAIKLFYSQSSFEMVYQEAVANALDAGATDVNITFLARSLTNVKSYKLIIEDNGIGFTNERYEKFCRLLEVDKNDKTHRGLGRLVYLFYFNKVEVRSNYENTKHREFSFDEELGKAAGSYTEVEPTHSGVELELTGYNLSKLYDKNFANPEWIKRLILKKFYSRLYLAKKDGAGVTIKITSEIGDRIDNAIIDTGTLPEFEEKKFTSPFSLDGEMIMFYSVRECEYKESSVITALSIDNRNESIEVFADESVPQGYEMVFILFSDSFQGQTDPTRQSIALPSATIKMLKQTFRSVIIEILSEKLPKVIEATKAVNTQINDKFPHLSGYFDDDTIGISSQSDVIKEAQNKFFQAQREILCKSELTDEEFEKSLDLSGRALTEYVLFRQLTIDKLHRIKKKELESEIHNIIVPQRTILQSEHFVDNVYRNCSWILDEKFMTYSTVLSEREMSDLISQITDYDVDRDNDRPDIAIIFSDDPKTATKVDVVIVELKKKGLKSEENVKVEVQLEKRARKLYDIYRDKIQRLWLYGVAELDNEYKSHLSTAGYHPLYSKGTVFVNTNDITVDWESNTKIPADRYIMDIQALVDDADARNTTFLNIVKGKFTK